MANTLDIEGSLQRLIIEAYTSGLSVIEITFVINRNSADYVHKLLRTHNYIDPLPSNIRRFYEADRVLLSALKSKRYSFAKWSVGWGFNPEDAESELAGKLDGKVKGAIKRDFPRLFERLYGEKSIPLIQTSGSYSFNHPTFLTGWDTTKKEYVCTLVDDPTVRSTGADIEEAVLHFQDTYRSINREKCLNEAIRKFNEAGTEMC